MQSKPHLPLSGTRVVEFTWQIAGPIATALLAFLGAEVIKVESLTRLDGGRRKGGIPDPEMVNSVPVFTSRNPNKLGIQLNLSRPEGRQLARRLIAICDVVAVNMRPGVMERLGLGYEELRVLRPDIVMACVSGMGYSGPESHYTAYAAHFSAVSGLSSLGGYPDSDIPLEGRAPMDVRAGTALTFAIVVALWNRQRTGRGQFVDACASAVLTSQIGEYLMDCVMNGRDPKPSGNRDQRKAPHGLYPCRGVDAWVSVAVGTDEEWRALCRAIGCEELLADPRFADGLLRWKNQDALDPIIGSWTRERTPGEVTRCLQAHGVAAMPCLSGKDAAEDPHLLARRWLIPIVHPVMGPQKVVGPPWRFSKVPQDVYAPPPLLGQHNAYVYEELLGIPRRELEKLTEAEVVL